MKMILRFCSLVPDKSIYRKDTSQSESISKLNAKHAFYLFYNKIFFETRFQLPTTET